MALDYMLRDQITEYRKQIDHLHLNYLHTDESPRKIDEKKRLEGLIREFLCAAQHGQKFIFHETREVLRRSVESKEDFSPFRATAAWTAIAAYAHNLLAQPWRKEYHEIKTYCGYYKHNIESNLVGAEMMLEAMGYKHTTRSTMVLEGPVDPDRVTGVSRDSLVALVECQILRSIYTEVLKILPSCTWPEVLQFRETHVCNPEQAIRGLTYRLQQRRYDDSVQLHYRSQLENYGSVNRYHHPEQCPYAQRLYNCTLPSRYGLISPQQTMPPAYPQPMYHIKPHEVYPGAYYHQNGFIPLQVPSPPVVVPNYCAVPTGQLIELDMPHEHAAYNTNTHRRSASDHRVDHDRKNGDRYPSDVYSRSTTSDDLGSRKSGKKEGDKDVWNYVYQGLEEKSGKKKEVLEKKKENIRSTSPLDFEEALKAFSLNDLHQISVPEQNTLKINEALLKLRSDVDRDAKKKENRVSVYDNSSPPLSSSPKQASPVVKDTRKRDDLNFLDARKLKVKLSDKWECVSCTYHNTGGRDVCEMCGKSRNRGGESKPLASGGRQCPKCTLVNEKGVTTCDACGQSLKDSPTYI